MDEISEKNIEQIADGITRFVLILMDRGILPGFIPNKELDSNQIRDGVAAGLKAMIAEIARD